jgi:hypothetical protein
MRMSTTQGSSMTKQATTAWVGTFVPYSVLSTKGGDGDVRNRNEQLQPIGFAGEGISARSLWGGESGG